MTQFMTVMFEGFEDDSSMGDLFPSAASGRGDLFPSAASGQIQALDISGSFQVESCRNVYADKMYITDSVGNAVKQQTGYNKETYLPPGTEIIIPDIHIPDGNIQVTMSSQMRHARFVAIVTKNKLYECASIRLTGETAYFASPPTYFARCISPKELERQYERISSGHVVRMSAVPAANHFYLSFDMEPEDKKFRPHSYAMTKEVITDLLAYMLEDGFQQGFYV
jgi:hypothetical protein